MSLSKWRRCGITTDVMKDFCIMFGCKPAQIKLSEGQVITERLTDIIPKNHDWEETLWAYHGLMKRIDHNTPYQSSAWHKKEVANETKDIPGRFNKFKILYFSIKKSGFAFKKRQHIKLLNVSNIKRVAPDKGGRISQKYYRINGMKRLLICNYLGIQQIPVKIYGVKL